MYLIPIPKLSFLVQNFLWHGQDYSRPTHPREHRQKVCLLLLDGLHLHVTLVASQMSRYLLKHRLATPPLPPRAPSSSPWLPSSRPHPNVPAPPWLAVSPPPAHNPTTTVYHLAYLPPPNLLLINIFELRWASNPEHYVLLGRLGPTLQIQLDTSLSHNSRRVPEFLVVGNKGKIASLVTPNSYAANLIKVVQVSTGNM
jgi:hypothetical protein